VRNNEEYDTLLLDAYNGEVFGDAFFGAMAAAQPDPERRAKLEVLQTVEARTATSLRRLLANAGLHADDATSRKQGEELAAGLEPENWDEFISGLHGALPDFLAKFERLRDIAGTPTDPALVALVNHERAIERFAELEMNGDDKGSLKPLEEHLRRPA
jgi:hypothetical protein